MKYRNKGFTLLELMIVVAIVALLAALAYPSYLGQVRKSRRAEAAIALETMAQAQERFYSRFRTYTSVVAAPDGCAGQACGLGQNSASSEHDYYGLTSNGNATSYTLTATATESQFNDTDCRTLTVNSVGVKSGASASDGDTTDICW